MILRIVLTSVFLMGPPLLAQHEYSFTLKNTSPSTIYVINDPQIADETEVQDLEKVDSIALSPHESDTVDLGPKVAIYTRLPKTTYFF